MGVIISINKKDKGKEISKKISRSLVKQTSGFPAAMFLGKMKIGGKPVNNQRKIRDEWD
ncbi:MAG: hypothetical protein MUE71_05415 [Chitinophagaceae bacterium]|nr:hypothetical protein [Chitinophagaceae bacterium]